MFSIFKLFVAFNFIAFSSQVQRLKYFKEKACFSYKSVKLTQHSWLEVEYLVNETKDMEFTNKSIMLALIKENDDLKFNEEIVNLLQQHLNYKIEAKVIDSNFKLDTDLLILHSDHSPPKNYSLLHQITESNYVLVYLPSKFTKDIFILTFAGTLWFSFIIVLILLALCLRIATHYYSLIYSKTHEWSWVEITLWAIAAACQQGYSYTPLKFASRCIFLLGYIMAYLLYTGFAAAITSVVLHHDVRYVKGKQIGLIAYKLPITYTNLKIDRYVSNIADLFATIENSNYIALAPKLYVQQYLSTHKIQHKYSIMPFNDFDKFKTNIFINITSHWKDILKEKLILLEQGGFMKNIRTKLSAHVTNDETINGYTNAGLEHVGSANYVFLIGCGTALLFLIIELLVNLYKKRNK